MLGLDLSKYMGTTKKEVAAFHRSVDRIMAAAKKAHMASPGIGRACSICGTYDPDDHSKAAHFPKPTAVEAGKEE